MLKPPLRIKGEDFCHLVTFKWLWRSQGESAPVSDRAGAFGVSMWSMDVPLQQGYPPGAVLRH